MMVVIFEIYSVHRVVIYNCYNFYRKVVSPFPVPYVVYLHF